MRPRNALLRALAALSLVLAAAALSGAASCGASVDVPVEARVRTDLNPILRTAYVNTVQTVTAQILNDGQTALTISGVRVAAADGGALPSGTPFTQPSVAADATTDGGLPATVNGRSTGFAVFTFGPKKAGRVEAALVIDSSAPATPTLTVPIYACGALPDGGGCTCPDGGPFLADGGC
jgi:hypothetical protein